MWSKGFCNILLCRVRHNEQRTPEVAQWLPQLVLKMDVSYETKFLDLQFSSAAITLQRSAVHRALPSAH